VLTRLQALGAVLLVLLVVLPSTAAAAGMTRTETRLLRDLNRVRAQHGLPPLRYDPRLQRAARAHTREMLATGVFQHGALAPRLARFSVRATLAGENLAWGTGSESTAKAIVDAWLASPEHRANLLRPSFSRVGIGDLVGAFLGASGAHVVTADFAN
jgi:uncharacterized protein YkwD